MKRIVSIMVLVTLTLSVFAQNETDALRYSQSYTLGTARSASMGGAFGSLGADFSCLSSNPAGVAVYRKTELTFTPSLYYDKTSSDFLGNSYSDFKYNFNLSNVGMVAAFHGDNDSTGWVGLNIGFGYNRTNNFNQDIRIEGINNSNSLTDYFAKLAKGNTTEQLLGNNIDLWSATMAWDAYLIDTLSTSQRTYRTTYDKYGEKQRLTINSKGAAGEYLFSMGANYSNRLYVGGSIAFNNVHYESLYTFMETDEDNLIDSINNFTYKKRLVTSGSGFTLKIGTIIRPVDFVRVGIAIHTPTFLQLENRYYNKMSSNFDNGYSTDYAFERDSVHSYSLSTPLKAIGSLGFVIMKTAIVGVDVEYIDYATMGLNSDDYDFADENSKIQSMYKPTCNIKAGAEYRIGEYSVRAGYALYGSPNGKDFINSSFSGGFGLRQKAFFFDVAYIYSQNSENYHLYNPDVISNEPAKITDVRHQVMMTLGFKF